MIVTAFLTCDCVVSLYRINSAIKGMCYHWVDTEYNDVCELMSDIYYMMHCVNNLIIFYSDRNTEQGVEPRLPSNR